ncbi:DUF4399 domain-containing protein [Zobellella iuensis]|uniref:DUF4399 domain-containing protein n=1 Tax=Zobellella iuensis TaxID=2803811 RepID=A0ABS1QSD9_9GAMM|nr:DUF4399 domain-containing protein [Zobellella iuensis]MBL1377028.1 DUF4399 domain-containing protein [Zobellella iuensis]
MSGASIFTLAAVLAAATLMATPSPEGARVYFITPADGEVVSTEFTVRFGLQGMGVAPAGVELPNTGHHHLLINAEAEDLSQPLPASERVLHFGGGQTETRLSLPPGEYRLQLVLGDHLHIPHQPPLMSEPIKVTVE